MRRNIPILAILALVLAVTGVWAQAPGGPEGPEGPKLRSAFGGPGGGPHGPHGAGGPAFERYLFPPELVLSNQLAIGLGDEQVQAIKDRLNQTHAAVIDAQTELQRVSERLHGILEPATVDEAAVLAAAEEAMALESRIKRAHLSLLVQVKNLLTEEQQAKLNELRRPGAAR